MKKRSPFSRLYKLSKEASLLSGIHALLEWDQETFLPSEAITPRSEQLSLLARLIHEKRASRSYGKYLSPWIDLTSGELQRHDLTQEEKALLREWRRDYLLATKLPSSFVEEFAWTTSASIHAWTEAKQTSNFSLFAPHLQKVIDLCRKKADFLGYQEHAYDALLDLYEPGLTLSSLRPLFFSMKELLMNLVQKIVKASPPTLSKIEGIFPSAAQQKLGQELLVTLGLPSSASRLDLSSHPFCTGIHPLDIRMTTRIHEDNPFSSLFSVLHEGGHALYHRNLPKEHYGTPLCEAVSYGIDESQSRFFETILGKSLPFWHFMRSKLQTFFPEQFSSISTEELYLLINQVEPTFIRVEADEVTYGLHILLRFELEVAILEGSLQVSEIPDAWNEQMQKLLGLLPKNDREGCLQDIHWAMGGFGYFPTYALGNLLAAQLFTRIEQQIPLWGQQVENGNFSAITSWLHANIHQHGKTYEAKDLILRATGEPLGVTAYKNYLENKYKKIYAL
ncbi:MAG: carboxypeptidase M32 [Chlamydiae bacterium]|nr:carboxypeptidase M32 [Chlamydiota bacterium]